MLRGKEQGKIGMRGSLLFVLLLIFISGCSYVSDGVDDLYGYGCHRISCDPLFAECEWGSEQLECTDEEKLGEVCDYFYECEGEGINCVAKKHSEYDNCVSCFENAESVEERVFCERSYLGFVPLE